MYTIYVQDNFSPVGVHPMMTYLNEKMLYIRIYNVGQSQGVIWAIFRVFFNNFS